MSQTGAQPEVFGIGAVVNRTGLTAANIRVWEKRYQAVMPQRNETNRRLYCRNDIERLYLMKRLTDGGHAISRIANLSLDELQSLSVGLPEATTAEPSLTETRETNRVLVVGIGLLDALKGEPEIDLRPYETDMESALEQTELPQTDLLLIEAETFFPETRGRVIELMQRSNACRALVVYCFASERDAGTLVHKEDGISLLRGPVDPARLRRECYLQLRVMSAHAPDGPPLDADDIPLRIFDSAQLAKLTRIESAVNCECPRHLADLLKRLEAFESYSEACEDRNADDAMIHAYLHRTTAHARRSMEEALQNLLKAEGIALD